MKIIPNEEKIVDYYQKQAREHGFGAKGMDWKNEASQDLRFEMINRYIDFTEKPSILDVGCGGGGYYKYCKERNLDLVFKGIDIAPDMVDFVKAEYGQEMAEVASIANISENSDYVIASGTYNTKLDAEVDNWETYVFESIEHMFRVSNKAIVLNLMTPYVDYKYDRLYYPDLNILTSFITKKMTRNFIIDHSYDLYEVTLAIYK